jgi:uncharacterized protein (DUF1330 family)
MSYEVLTAMEVTDAEAYGKYREAMRPILESYGGGFRYDFWIKETLQTDAKHPVNRVFAIYFKDKASREAFFANPEYLEIRRKYFEPSVKARTVIAEYER